ncbi:hypothetical protein V2J09_017419 [Rumex salicifolius]
MAQVIRANFRPLRLSPQIQCFNFLKHAIFPCMNAGSERLSFVALPNSCRSAHFRSHSLRRREAQVDLDPRYGRSSYTEESDANKISRNIKKREARQAVRWGMDLASFSSPQIKRILRVASLDGEDTFAAIMLAKRLGPDVREGKRRQFNYIGKLLRDANPELLGALIQATKDGDHATIQALSRAQEAELDEKEEDISELESEEEEEEEDTQQFVALANKWFDGLINKDIEISNEVYSISGVEFDRQELRKLVRKAQSIEEKPRNVEENVEEDEEKTNSKLKAAQGSLARFLLRLAKQTSVEQFHVA